MRKRQLEETCVSPYNDPESGEEDAIRQRADKNRERNREHAKRTRLRKKEMIERLKIRLLELQREAVEYEQLLEESNTASILMCLGDQTGSGPENGSLKLESMDENSKLGISKGNIVDQLRQCVRAEAAKSRGVQADVRSDASTGEDATSGENSIHSNDNSVDGGEFPNDMEEELERVGVSEVEKRERNRMHAKLTRDRKKLFTSRMQQLIHTLERHNLALRGRLSSIIQGRFFSTSPDMSGMHVPVPGVGGMGNLGLEQLAQLQQTFEAGNTGGGLRSLRVGGMSMETSGMQFTHSHHIAQQAIAHSSMTQRAQVEAEMAHSTQWRGVNVRVERVPKSASVPAD